MASRSAVVCSVLVFAAVLLPVVASAEGSPEREPCPAGRLCLPTKGEVVRDLLGSVEEIRANPVPREIQESLVPPPRSEPREPRAWSDLEATLAFLEAGVAAPEHASWRWVLRAAQRAHRELARVDTDLPAAMRELRQILAHLPKTKPPAGPDAFASEASARLAAVVAQLARESLERARRAGARSEQLADAETALGQGLDLAEAGLYVEAQAPFGGAFDLTTSLAEFDLDRFEQNVRDAFSGETVGYAYAINRGGLLDRTGRSGKARTSVASDAPETDSNASKEMNVASVSKIVTTLAVLRLLRARAIPVDASVYFLLPPDWAKGEGILFLTFRDLLTHKSGLNDNLNGPYALSDLEGYIAAGIDEADKTYQYQNANFSLFRVLIPYVAYGPVIMDFLETIFSFLFINREEMLAFLYEDFVRDHVFGPTGFVDGRCRPVDPTPVLYYPWPYAGESGLPPTNWSLFCGGGGWHLSPVELAGLMAHQRYNDAFLPPYWRDLMDEGYLGWNDPHEWGWADGAYGIYRSHGGDIQNLNACIMGYPNGVSIALLINSDDSSGWGGYQCQALADAYDDAWVVP